MATLGAPRRCGGGTGSHGLRIPSRFRDSARPSCEHCRGAAGPDGWSSWLSRRSSVSTMPSRHEQQIPADGSVRALSARASSPLPEPRGRWGDAGGSMSWSSRLSWRRSPQSRCSQSHQHRQVEAALTTANRPAPGPMTATRRKASAVRSFSPGSTYLRLSCQQLEAVPDDCSDGGDAISIECVLVGDSGVAVVSVHDLREMREAQPWEPSCRPFLATTM